MTFAYSLIKFCNDRVAFNIALRPANGKLEFAFNTLQTWIDTHVIEQYEVVSIDTQSIELRIQLNVKQIVWNNGIEICFKSYEEA